MAKKTDIGVQEFRYACDTLLRFIQQQTKLTDDDRMFVVAIIQTLQHKLAPFTSTDDGRQRPSHTRFH